MKILICALVLCCSFTFAKSDTIAVVNCKCDTIKIVRDTIITVKLDTLKKVEQKAQTKVKK